MQYKPLSTALKMLPASIVPIVAEFMQAIQDNPENLSERKAYLIGTIALALFQGLKNLIKNWRRGR